MPASVVARPFKKSIKPITNHQSITLNPEHTYILITYLEHTYFFTARLWSLRTRICERDPNYYRYLSQVSCKDRSTGNATMSYNWIRSSTTGIITSRSENLVPCDPRAWLQGVSEYKKLKFFRHGTLFGRRLVENKKLHLDGVTPSFLSRRFTPSGDLQSVTSG